MPGPQPTSTEVLAKRGSWRAKARLKEPSGPKGKSLGKSGITTRPLLAVRKRVPKFKCTKEILRLIPGYDPFANADDFTFDDDLANRAVNFFPQRLRHVKGALAGEPFVLKPWQQTIIANLFGWQRKDGTRRYREALVYVPRKNGKSSLAAGIVLYMMFIDAEFGAEIYSAAAERDQAALIFDIVKQMIKLDPDLYKNCHLYMKAIVREELGISYKAISADANTKHGYNPTCVVIDELHAQRDRRLVDVLITSTASRKQPLIIYLTTADYDRDESICNEKYHYACRVRDGIIDDPYFLPVIHEASRDDDWCDEATWRKANPNIEVSVPIEYLKRECQRAQDSPAYENTYKRLHLNIITEQSSRWLVMRDWDECKAEIDWDTYKGCACYAGLDLATVNDLASCVLIFEKDDKVAIRSFFWCPHDNAVTREKNDRVPYTTWARKGLIELTDGNVIDYRFIRKRINELGEQYKIIDIRFDPYNATHLATQLSDEDGFELVQMRQGTLSMNEPSKALERAMKSRELQQDGNDVMRWMISNVAVKVDHVNNIMPDKARSSGRIDGVVAMIMAFGGLIAHQGPKKSVYEDRELVVI